MSKGTKLMALLLALVMTLAVFAACGGDETTPTPAGSSTPTSSSTPGSDGPDGPGYDITEFDPSKKYTYNAWTSGLASNWNPHDYRDSTASDQMGYLVDSFYTFAFNDALHPHADATHTPFDGYVIIPSMAAGLPVDVTAEVAKAHPDWIPEGATSGYAWAIPMREDLYFDNGTHITANTYVEGMKRILDYKLQNYRSTDIYQGTYGIVGAEAYFYQGQIKYKDNGIEGIAIADMTKGADGKYTYNGNAVYIALNRGLDWLQGDKLAEYVDTYGDAYFGTTHWAELKAAANENGDVALTDETLAWLTDVVTSNPAWGETDGTSVPSYLVIAEKQPDGFKYEDTVGYYAKDEYTLVQVFKASCSGFTLYYNAIQDSLVLVEPTIYDNCIKQDADGSYYSTYMTSVATSPSYGPYSLTNYQTDKLAHYSRNEKWYGYHDDVNNVYQDPTDGKVYRLYQTTDIDIQMLAGDAAVSTAKNMFLQGQLVSYGLQAADMAEFQNSEYFYHNPDATVFFMLLTGDLEGLRARESDENFDKTKNDLETITLENFRKAFAVSFNRQAYCDETSPSLTPAFGIFGSTVIYNPETSALYRDTDVAKKALCDFYSVDPADFGGDLDKAVASITGFDPEAAKELYTKAFDDAIKAGYITDTDNDGKSDQTISIVYVVGGTLNDAAKLQINWMDKAFKEAVKGTPFEGKVEIVPSTPYNGENKWADDLRSGLVDLCLAGWEGSAMDPYNLLQAYTWPSYAYAANWYDPTHDDMTLTLKGETITMSVYDWAECVTGNDITVGDKTYNFGSNDADEETRMLILAAIEGKLLQTFTYIPFANNGTAMLLSMKVYYVVDEYNAVMGRGGIAYLKYNYDDEAWAQYCQEQIAQNNGRLPY